MVKMISFLMLLVCHLSACNLQDSKYLHPCAGKYGSPQVIHNIKTKYHLENANIVFDEWYKEPARIPRNCDTIHSYIAFNNASLLSEDTFAISIGHLFFSDSSNSDVKYLDLRTENFWPMIGNVKTEFLLCRDSLARYSYQPITTFQDSENQVYQIIGKTFTKSDDGSKGLEIVATFAEDVKDAPKMAATIKKQYLKEIANRGLTEFSVEMRLQNPSCKLCQNKTYVVFFDKRNKNMY
jgi:hypothetical protein